MLKNDNEGNFKIKIFAENRKEWNFYMKNSFGWVILRVFAVFTITFLKELIFWPKITILN
jgi:hypothetical protein